MTGPAQDLQQPNPDILPHSSPIEPDTAYSIATAWIARQLPFFTALKPKEIDKHFNLKEWSKHFSALPLRIEIDDNSQHLNDERKKVIETEYFKQLMYMFGLDLASLYVYIKDKYITEQDDEGKKNLRLTLHTIIELILPIFTDQKHRRELITIELDKIKSDIKIEEQVKLMTAAKDGLKLIKDKTQDYLEQSRKKIIEMHVKLYHHGDHSVNPAKPHNPLEYRANTILLWIKDIKDTEDCQQALEHAVNHTDWLKETNKENPVRVNNPAQLLALIKADTQGLYLEKILLKTGWWHRKRFSTVLANDNGNTVAEIILALAKHHAAATESKNTFVAERLAAAFDYFTRKRVWFGGIDFFAKLKKEDIQNTIQPNRGLALIKNNQRLQERARDFGLIIPPPTISFSDSYHQVRQAPAAINPNASERSSDAVLTPNSASNQPDVEEEGPLPGGEVAESSYCRNSTTLHPDPALESVRVIDDETGSFSSENSQSDASVGSPQAQMSPPIVVGSQQMHFPASQVSAEVLAHPAISGVRITKTTQTKSSLLSSPADGQSQTNTPLQQQTRLGL